MKLRKEIIERIRGNQDVVPNLMKCLNKSRQMINREIRMNKDNGTLTTLAAILAISKSLNVNNEDVLS